MINLFHNRAFQNLLIMLCAVGVVALFAFSMRKPQSVVEGLPDGTNFDLKTNTQLEFEDLGIGAGNFRVDNCNNIPCSTAGLWIYYKDHPELDQKVRVQDGDTFIVGSYQIRVMTVSRRIFKSDFVRLSIKNISSPQTSLVADGEGNFLIVYAECLKLSLLTIHKVIYNGGLLWVI